MKPKCETCNDTGIIRYAAPPEGQIEKDACTDCDAFTIKMLRERAEKWERAYTEDVKRLEAELSRLREQLAERDAEIVRMNSNHIADLNAQDAELSQLREAGINMANQIQSGRKGHCGDHHVYVVQISEESLLRFRAALEGGEG